MEKNKFLMSPRSFSCLLPLLFFVLFTGCEKESMPETFESTVDLQTRANNPASSKLNNFYGPAEPFNGGVVRTMVTMTRDGVPVEIGVRISEKVLEDLPEQPQIITLDLPNKMVGLTFEHVDLDWNPGGHDPENIYTLPHFDVHFFMVSTEYKKGITVPDKGVIYPDDIYWPENYVHPPLEAPAELVLVPKMGVHWLNSLAPELPPTLETFTHTFIYGSYDGSFIFMEPMVTLDYLVKHADGTAFTIFQPEQFEQSGYYPTTYKMYYDGKHKDYVISMGDMKWYD